MCITALFIIARTWKQPNVHQQISSGILLSHKNKWNCAIWRHTDGPRDCHTEWSGSERKIYMYINNKNKVFGFKKNFLNSWCSITTKPLIFCCNASSLFCFICRDKLDWDHIIILSVFLLLYLSIMESVNICQK